MTNVGTVGWNRIYMAQINFEPFPDMYQSYRQRVLSVDIKALEDISQNRRNVDLQHDFVE